MSRMFIKYGEHIKHINSIMFDIKYINKIDSLNIASSINMQLIYVLLHAYFRITFPLLNQKIVPIKNNTRKKSKSILNFGSIQPNKHHTLFFTLINTKYKSRTQITLQYVKNTTLSLRTRYHI